MKTLSLRRIFQRLVRIEHLISFSPCQKTASTPIFEVSEWGENCTCLIEASSDVFNGKRTQAQHLKLEGEEEGFWRRGTGHVQDGVVI
jgi:hypothetical protein